jgi:hypothetical protein
MVSISSTATPPPPKKKNIFFFAVAVSGINTIFVTDGKCKGQSTGTISEGIFGLVASCASA